MTKRKIYPSTKVWLKFGTTQYVQVKETIDQIRTAYAYAETNKGQDWSLLKMIGMTGQTVVVNKDNISYLEALP